MPSTLMYFVCDFYVRNSQWIELPHSAHRVHLCILTGYQNKQRLLSCFALLIFTTRKESTLSSHLPTFLHFTVLLHSQYSAGQLVNKRLV